MLFSKKAIEERWDKDSANRDFVLAHWFRISKAQALRNNPHLKSVMAEYEEGKERVYWYACDMQVGNRCLVHKERPSICEGYPWYGNEPGKEQFLYGENCGYKIDQLFGKKVGNVRIKKISKTA